MSLRNLGESFITFLSKWCTKDKSICTWVRVKLVSHYFTHLCKKYNYSDRCWTLDYTDQNSFTIYNGRGIGAYFTVIDKNGHDLVKIDTYQWLFSKTNIKRVAINIFIKAILAEEHMFFINPYTPLYSDTDDKYSLRFTYYGYADIAIKYLKLFKSSPEIKLVESPSLFFPGLYLFELPFDTSDEMIKFMIDRIIPIKELING